MLYRISLLAAILSGAACGGAYECNLSRHQAVKTYKQVFTERDGGTCGPLPAAVSNGLADPNCSEVLHYADDECSARVTLRCQYDDVLIVATGTVTQDNADGTELSGVADAVADGICASTYDIVYTAL